MASIYDWSKTAASNSNADAAINWAEGMDPAAVNDSARQEMARVAEWRDDITGTITAGGSANALTVTANSGFTTLANGRMVAFIAASDNTGAATLNINGIGAKSIRKMDATGDVALTGGEIQAGGVYLAAYNAAMNGAAGGWMLVNPTLAMTVPASISPSGSGGASFTGLPAGIKRLTITFSSLSVNGAFGLIALQIGDSGGLETSGYVGVISEGQAASNVRLDFGSAVPSGFPFSPNVGAAQTFHGAITLTRLSTALNTWIATGNIARTDTTYMIMLAGAKTLSGELDRVAVVANDLFDAGIVGLTYEL
jgi:hypothetical protein